MGITFRNFPLIDPNQSLPPDGQSQVVKVESRPCESGHRGSGPLFEVRGNFWDLQGTQNHLKSGQQVSTTVLQFQKTRLL